VIVRLDPHLSKSRYVAGLQRPKMLWWKVHEPDASEAVPDADVQALLDRGQAVGVAARTHVPGGVLIDLPPYRVWERVAATAAAMASRARVIYEASFVAEGVFISVDILARRRNGFVHLFPKGSPSAGGPAVREALGVTLVVIDVKTARQFDQTTFTAEMMRAHVDGFWVSPTLLNWEHRGLIVDVAATHRLPAMYGDRAWVDTGGLMAYSTSWPALRRRAAVCWRGRMRSSSSGPAHLGGRFPRPRRRAPRRRGAAGELNRIRRIGDLSLHLSTERSLSECGYFQKRNTATAVDRSSFVACRAFQAVPRLKPTTSQNRRVEWRDRESS
jgi:hypothetical protein